MLARTKCPWALALTGTVQFLVHRASKLETSSERSASVTQLLRISLTNCYCCLRFGCRGNDGKPYVLDTVRQAEQIVLQKNMNHEYAGIAGEPCVLQTSY
jgi:hypothetical protein